MHAVARIRPATRAVAGFKCARGLNPKPQLAQVICVELVKLLNSTAIGVTHKPEAVFATIAHKNLLHRCLEHNWLCLSCCRDGTSNTTAHDHVDRRPSERYL